MVLGADFFKEFKSVISYETGSPTFAPMGKEGPTIAMRSPARELAAKLRSVKSRGSTAASAGAKPPQHRAVRLTEDVVIAPFEEQILEMSVHPALENVPEYDGIFEPGTTGVMENLVGRGAKLALTAVRVASANAVHTKVVNTSSVPLVIKRNTHLG